MYRLLWIQANDIVKVDFQANRPFALAFTGRLMDMLPQHCTAWYRTTESSACR